MVANAQQRGAIGDSRLRQLWWTCAGVFIAKQLRRRALLLPNDTVPVASLYQGQHIPACWLAEDSHNDNNMPIAPADDHTGGPAAASRSRMLTLGVGSALIVSLCYALIAWGEAAADVGDLNRPQSMGSVGGQTALRDYNGLQSGGSTKRATSSSSPTTVPTASPSASARPTACVDSAGWSNGHGN